MPCPSKFESGDFTVTQEQIDLLGNELVENNGSSRSTRSTSARWGRRPHGSGDRLAGHARLQRAGRQLLRLRRDDVHGRVLRARLRRLDRHERHRHRRVRLGQPCRPDDAEWRDDDPSNDQATLYEGVVAHELEHLLHSYSDPGELSWVDEGLADFAVFLNGFDVGGSHLTYQQVFYADTSLTRWAGGLQNYGAAYTFFQYLWEQAGGNGDGTYTPDLQYDGAGGDLLIKLIFAEQADGMIGVQNAIDDFNAEAGPRSAQRRGAVPGLGGRRLPGRRGIAALRHQGRRLRRPGVHVVDDRHRRRVVLERPRQQPGCPAGAQVGAASQRAVADGGPVRSARRALPQPGAERRRDLLR